MPETLSEWIEEIGHRLNVPLDDRSIASMLEYVRLLREWNEKINLTAILDDEGIAIRHLMDSLTLLPFLEQYEKSASVSSLRLIDVGTGAGFPGLPLKIIKPDLQVLLLDSLSKRIKFLDEVIESLQLSKIISRHDRAEDAARRREYREQFDIATARAVAPLATLCEYCLPFVRVGGVFLAMKGQNADEGDQASRAIQILGGKLTDVSEFELPGTDMKRTILTIRKTRPTPSVYPRKAGKPEQQPLA